MALMPNIDPQLGYIRIEFGDDFQDMDTPPAYALVGPVLTDMMENPGRYGVDRTGFVLALIPWIELLMHDQEDEALWNLADRDPIFEELFEQLLAGREEENKQAPDLAWSWSVIDYVVKYIVERRAQLMDILPEWMAPDEDDPKERMLA